MDSWSVLRSNNHTQTNGGRYNQAWRAAVEKPMVRFDVNLSINPRSPDCLGFGTIMNGMGMGIVHFAILGSTSNFVVKIER